MSVAEFQITGLDPVLKKLAALQGKQMLSAIRSALTKGARIPRDAARRKAASFDDPESPSNIAKNIVTRYSGKRSKREGGVVVQVGVAGGARPAKGNEDTGHWRLKEFGTSQMPADPFMRPALSDNAEKVTSEFAGDLDKAIDKIVAKGAR
jgi:HK97 gp10 family phage protein